MTAVQEDKGVVWGYIVWGCPAVPDKWSSRAIVVLCSLSCGSNCACVWDTLTRWIQGLGQAYGFDGTQQAAVGGMQAILNDVLLMLNAIGIPPIPPHWGVLSRALVTLEGIALQGDPHYSLIRQAYPFVARKLLKSDRPEAQRVLLDLVYGPQDTGTMNTKVDRLVAFLNAATGDTAEGPPVDLRSSKTDASSLQPLLHYILSPSAAEVRQVLEDEAVEVSSIPLEWLPAPVSPSSLCPVPPRCPSRSVLIGGILSSERTPLLSF